MKNLWMRCWRWRYFQASALAEGTMGNGSGWCQPTNGTHNFPLFNQNHYRYGWEPDGTIVEEHWSAGGEYSAKCDCDNSDTRAQLFHRDHRARSDAERHAQRDAILRTYDYYVPWQASKLEIGAPKACSRKLNQNIPVPFSSISNTRIVPQAAVAMQK